MIFVTQISGVFLFLFVLSLQNVLQSFYNPNSNRFIPGSLISFSGLHPGAGLQKQK